MVRIANLFLVLMLSCLVSYAQDKSKYNMVIHKVDGSKNYYQTEKIDSITFDNAEGYSGQPSGVSIKRIYGNGSSYCAFTSLTKNNGIYYLAFREGESHVSEGDYGIIKILVSSNGNDWHIMQTVSLKEVDLRDPCLSVTPNGEILLLCGARYKTNDGNYATKTYYAKENKGAFEEIKPVVVPEEIDDKYCCWIWRITWNDIEGYGVVYRSNDNHSTNITLVKTFDGITYSRVTDIELGGDPSETKLSFLKDGTLMAMIRRDGGNKKGYMGYSKYPYTEWNLKELDIYLAGQDFLVDEDLVICSTRLRENIGDKTNIWIGNLDGVFSWSYVLPSLGSGGDTSYTGLLNENDEYWISYYSKHEFNKPAIYLAKIPKILFEAYRGFR